MSKKTRANAVAFLTRKTAKTAKPTVKELAKAVVDKAKTGKR